MTTNLIRSDSGQSMTEFLIVLPVLILTIFGTIQLGLIYSAKNTLNYASFQAARIGAVNNASSEDIVRGLTQGLSPMFTHGASSENVEAGLFAASNEVRQFTRITRISPRLSQFSQSGYGEYDNDINHWIIPNDNLMYRDPTEIIDGASIQDANLLKIQVEYCYELLVPLVNRVLSSLSELNNNQPAQYFADLSSGLNTRYDAICGARGQDNQGFVISSEVIVRMQSPAYRDVCEDPMVCL